MITATIPFLKHNAREHDQTAVSLRFSGHSSLYRISIMGVLYHYYHLFSQNLTGWHNTTLPTPHISPVSPKPLYILLTLLFTPSPYYSDFFLQPFLFFFFLLFIPFLLSLILLPLLLFFNLLLFRCNHKLQLLDHKAILHDDGHQGFQLLLSGF